MVDAVDAAAAVDDAIDVDDAAVDGALPARVHRRVFSKRGRVRCPYSPTLEKYWYQRHALFSRYDAGVLLDAEGWYSTTPELVAMHTSQLMSASGSGLLFVDAFSGCGGNAIQQALHDPAGLVVAIDIDPDKVAMARHNARVYGVESRIQFIVGDFVALAPRLRAHVCFLSPPWGGPEYDGAGGCGGGGGGAAASASARAPATAPAIAASELASSASFRLTTLAQPCCGVRLFELAAQIAVCVGYYLPANTAGDDLSLLVRCPSRRGVCTRLVWGASKKAARPRALLFVCSTGDAPAVRESLREATPTPTPDSTPNSTPTPNPTPNPNSTPTPNPTPNAPSVRESLREAEAIAMHAHTHAHTEATAMPIANVVDGGELVCGAPPHMPVPVPVPVIRARPNAPHHVPEVGPAKGVHVRFD